jgi:DNA-binding CsgD family transcriptional regulator
VLVIQGSRGSGKTTLLHAALTRRPGLGAVLTARGHADEQGFALGVVRQLFDPLMSGSGRNGESAGADLSTTAGDRVNPGTNPRVDPGIDLDVSAGVIGLDARVSAASLATVPHAGGTPPVPADLLHSLYRATRSLTASHPLIIAIDDLNLADPQSAQWCSYITRRLDGLPIAMILTADTDDRGSDDVIRGILTLPYARSLRPSRLCRRCAGTLMESILDRPVDDEIAAACHRLTKGNPLLLRETLARLVAADVPPDRSELPKVMRIGATALSETVLQWLSGRYPAVIALLQSLAITAPYGGLETAAVLAGYGAVAAEEAGRALAGAGLLQGTPPDQFTHELVQATIVSRMDPRKRDDMHRRAASLLHRLGSPPKRSARHLMSASPTGDPWAVSVLREAAREAVAENAWGSATRYLHRALAEATDPAVVLDVTAELGAIEVHLDVPAALRHFRSVAALARDPAEKAGSLTAFATSLLTLNSAEAGDVFCDLAHRFDDGGERPPGRESLLRLSAQALMTGQSYGSREAMRSLRAEPGAGTTSGAQDYLAAVALSTAARGRHRNRTVMLARQCLDGGGAVPPPLVMALTWSGLLDEAAYWSQRVATEAHANASITGQALAAVLLSGISYQKAALTTSLTQARDGIRFAQASHAPGLHLAAVSCAVRVLIERDELDAAQSLCREVDAREVTNPLIHGHLLESWGRVSIARGDLQEGLRAVLEAGRQLLAAGVTNPVCLPWRGDAALAYLRLGQRKAARSLAEEELKLARAWGAPEGIGRSLSVVSTTVDGPHRVALLKEAVAALEEAGARLELIRATVRLGIAWRLVGDTSQAHDTLSHAYALAADSGAVRLAALAERNLAALDGSPSTSSSTTMNTPNASVTASPGTFLNASGDASPNGRSRGPAIDGRPPLTAGELRVTELVLQGMSNLQVATALSISKRTVDTHLARIYRKLGIHTRAELADIIQRTGDDPADPAGPAPMLEE